MELKKTWKLKKISLAESSASAEEQQEQYTPRMEHIEPDKFEPKKHKKSHSNNLPPDVYKPIISSERLLTRVEKNGKKKWKKEFLEIEVIRSGDDGLPMVSVKQLRATEKNPTPQEVKNRNLKIPLEILDIFIDALDDISYKTQDVLNELL